MEIFILWNKIACGKFLLQKYKKKIEQKNNFIENNEREPVFIKISFNNLESSNAWIWFKYNKFIF